MDGYRTQESYEVTTVERRDRVAFALRRIHRATPFRKRFHHDADDARRYRGTVRLGWSVGAYDGHRLVGLVLAEPHDWNRSVWVWELAVARPFRRQGIATALIRDVARHAADQRYRVLVCETQTTNVPAIDFYFRTGFHLEGVDLSYYANDDVREGEVSVFMKRRVHPGDRTARTAARGARPRSR